MEIHLNFIGEYELPNAEREPTQEEIAEQERIEKERERNRLKTNDASLEVFIIFRGFPSHRHNSFCVAFIIIFFLFLCLLL